MNGKLVWDAFGLLEILPVGARLFLKDQAWIEEKGEKSRLQELTSIFFDFLGWPIWAKIEPNRDEDGEGEEVEAAPGPNLIDKKTKRNDSYYSISGH